MTLVSPAPIPSSWPLVREWTFIAREKRCPRNREQNGGRRAKSEWRQGRLGPSSTTCTNKRTAGRRARVATGLNCGLYDPLMVIGAACLAGTSTSGKEA